MTPTQALKAANRQWSTLSPDASRKIESCRFIHPTALLINDLTFLRGGVWDEEHQRGIEGLLIRANPPVQLLVPSYRGALLEPERDYRGQTVWGSWRSARWYVFDGEVRAAWSVHHSILHTDAIMEHEYGVW